MDIISIIIWLLLWAGAGRRGGKNTTEKNVQNKKDGLMWEIRKLEQEARTIISDAEKKSSHIVQKAEEIVTKSEKEAEHKQKKIDQYEEKLWQKEEKLEQRIEKLDQKKEEILEKEKELDATLEKEKTILSDLSGMSPEDAKKQLFEQIETENKEEIKRFVNKWKSIKEEEAKDEAAQIIAKVLPRVAQEWLNEHVVSLIDLPSEDMKGKIIGREGRNINAFEKATGVEVTIDDTPMTIKISSFDPEKRFVAKATMDKLVKDGRINPVFIEKMYEEVLKGMPERFMKKGKEALTILNLPMMKPEVVETIGKFFLRYSYGQNLRLHSIEVAKLSELLANELWLNADLAKKAGLLHDIGKIESGNGEAHTRTGAEFLRKHKMHDVIVNTAEGHHFDVPMLYPEAFVVAAADAISASRLWARSDTKDIFIERMGTLENLITSVDGVEKAYIMSAGREIMAFFNPSTIDDKKMEELTGEIWAKIEEQLDYPGTIRIVGIREKKLTHFLR